MRFGMHRSVAIFISDAAAPDEREKHDWCGAASTVWNTSKSTVRNKAVARADLIQLRTSRIHPNSNGFTPWPCRFEAKHQCAIVCPYGQRCRVAFELPAWE